MKIKVLETIRFIGLGIMMGIKQTEYKSCRSLFNSKGKLIPSNHQSNHDLNKQVKLVTVVAGPPPSTQGTSSNREKSEYTSVEKVHGYNKRLYKMTTIVRKKAERALLNGYECSECSSYYKTFDLSPNELREKLKLCSKHRALAAPPKTPEHFWDIDFPEMETELGVETWQEDVEDTN
jgi:DNA repair protein endonuclease SAE2/CtIP C-terminus